MYVVVENETERDQIQRPLLRLVFDHASNHPSVEQCGIEVPEQDLRAPEHGYMPLIGIRQLAYLVQPRPQDSRAFGRVSEGSILDAPVLADDAEDLAIATKKPEGTSSVLQSLDNC